MINLIKSIFSIKNTVTVLKEMIKNSGSADGKIDSVQAEVIKSYHPYKLAQRVISFVIIIPYMLTYVLSVIMAFSGFDVSHIVYVNDEFDILYLVMMVVAFYFGGTLVKKS